MFANHSRRKSSTLVLDDPQVANGGMEPPPSTNNSGPGNSESDPKTLEAYYLRVTTQEYAMRALLAARLLHTPRF